MTNDEILEKRWKEVDELLSTFYSKNQKINRIANIGITPIL